MTVIRKKGKEKRTYKPRTNVLLYRLRQKLRVVAARHRSVEIIIK
jgi:hypothetical protein